MNFNVPEDDTTAEPSIVIAVGSTVVVVIAAISISTAPDESFVRTTCSTSLTVSKSMTAVIAVVLTTEIVSVPPLPSKTSVASNAAAAVPETIHVSSPEPP